MARGRRPGAPFRLPETLASGIAGAGLPADGVSVDAAHAPNAASARTAARLLDDIAALERPTRCDRHNARAQLESELGGELTRLLCGALVARRPRAGFLTLV
jgi:hypothetical protein